MADSAGVPAKSSTFAEIVAARFERLRAAGKRIDSITAEAEFLQLSAGHLSRLRNQKARLTEDSAQKIARGFEPRDGEARDRLFRELMAAHDASPLVPTSTAGPDVSLHALAHLFGRVAHERAMLAVSYAEWPQSTRDGAFPKFGIEAQDAIDRGCRFLMFNPFGSPDAMQTSASGTLGWYRLQLGLRVRQFLHETREALPKGARGEIALFEAREPAAAVSGIVSRLFYAEYVDREFDHHRVEVYEWIVGADDQHYFIERDRGTIFREAVRDQFDPIARAWRVADPKSSFRLPKTDKEFQKEYGGHAKRPLPWKLYEPEGAK